jgi:hypothetical protein
MSPIDSPIPAQPAVPPEAADGAEQTGTPAACTTTTPAGFEEFDLDDIGVIESKVFA